MAMTGETAKPLYDDDYVYVEFYNGPLDGEIAAIPRIAIETCNEIRTPRTPTQLMYAKYVHDCSAAGTVPAPADKVEVVHIYVWSEHVINIKRLKERLLYKYERSYIT